MSTTSTLSNKFWTSPKSCEETAKAIQESSLKHKFGVLTTFDLKAKMNEKGVPFDQDCRIVEVCNPMQAAKVLKENMNVSLALPCRISVFTDKGTTKIGFTLPSTILPHYMGDKPSPELVSVAGEVDETLIAIVEDALKGIQG
eukprot:TRINITY_DN1860_c0_g1_i1.p1 TRINITY_DN1860_c0_g1~~TRINITY_DN1860_c0_g1_i1.p1  ORF type:complete len:143 (+),score=18.85 TRINITY_DN1860_c0_g1_i1:54-482(+)